MIEQYSLELLRLLKEINLRINKKEQSRQEISTNFKDIGRNANRFIIRIFNFYLISLHHDKLLESFYFVQYSSDCKCRMTTGCVYAGPNIWSLDEYIQLLTRLWI